MIAFNRNKFGKRVLHQLAMPVLFHLLPHLYPLNNLIFFLLLLGYSQWDAAFSANLEEEGGREIKFMYFFSHSPSLPLFRPPFFSPRASRSTSRFVVLVVVLGTRLNFHRIFQFISCSLSFFQSTFKKS
jgi:hypothetical protein